jgi:hypothetical protein
MRSKGRDDPELMREIKDMENALSKKEQELEAQMRNEYWKQLEDPRVSEDTKQRLHNEFMARTGKQLGSGIEEHPKAE